MNRAKYVMWSSYFIAIVGWGWGHGAFAQQAHPSNYLPATTIRGVVWEIPEDFQEAAEDLLEMKLMGISAMRTGMVFDKGLLRMADSLGLVLYRELPFYGLGGQSLSDSLAISDSLVAALLESGQGFSSAGPVGLARNSDTSSRDGCRELKRLTDVIHQAGSLSYYVSNFIESDVCASSVDFVLLDALDQSTPANLIDRWKAKHDTPVGLARVGTSVVPGGEQGSLIQGSPQFQARFLENVFLSLQNAPSVGVFVHRWKDETRMAQQLPDPYRRKYGLYNRSKDPRPALYVTRGVYLGIQNTFVFERGDLTPRPLHWFTLVGWILLSMMAVIYAGSPRFRSIIPRYFFAHGFYRNAVREAREVLPLTSTALLTMMGLSIGLIATHVIITLKETRPVLHITSLLDEGLRTAFALVLDAPFVLAILMGSAALLFMSMWMGMWITASGRRSTLYPSQALMLAVWPRWQVIFILPVAMTFESTPGVPLWATGILMVVWIGCAYWATLRTAFDLFKVARIGPGMALFIWLLNPLILGTVALAIWGMFNFDDVAFVWHLIVRS